MKLRILKELFLRALGTYSKKSYAQDGEDLVLSKLVDTQRGFYVDVGSHHPFRFSNTFFFYKRGWSGINIDPLPGSMFLFDFFRQRDINLELGISKKAQKIWYYQFNDPALNTFSKEMSQERNSNSAYYVTDQRKVQTYPLAQVLKTHLPESTKIDFLTIDAEGLDFEILQSNDWKKYKPTVILVEMLGENYGKIYSNKITKFLQNKNYKLVAKTTNTSFFKVKTNGT